MTSYARAQEHPVQAVLRELLKPGPLDEPRCRSLYVDHVDDAVVLERLDGQTRRVPFGVLARSSLCRREVVERFAEAIYAALAPTPPRFRRFSRAAARRVP